MPWIETVCFKVLPEASFCRLSRHVIQGLRGRVFFSRLVFWVLVLELQFTTWVHFDL